VSFVAFVSLMSTTIYSICPPSFLARRTGYSQYSRNSPNKVFTISFHPPDHRPLIGINPDKVNSGFAVASPDSFEKGFSQTLFEGCRWFQIAEVFGQG